jgi:hypothetical protein
VASVFVSLWWATVGGVGCLVAIMVGSVGGGRRVGLRSVSPFWLALSIYRRVA